MSCTGDGAQDHGLRLVLGPLTPDPASDSGPVLSEGAGPASGPGPAEVGTGRTMVLADVRTGRRVSPLEHARVIARRWAKRFTAKPNNKRGLGSMVRSRLHKMYAGQPGSIASHRAHVKAAAWFPEELEGSWLKWVRFAWTAFHVTWCRFLKILGSTFSSAGDHARTAFALLVLVIVLIVVFA